MDKYWRIDGIVVHHNQRHEIWREIEHVTKFNALILVLKPEYVKSAWFNLNNNFIFSKPEWIPRNINCLLLTRSLQFYLWCDGVVFFFQGLVLAVLACDKSSKLNQNQNQYPVWVSMSDHFHKNNLICSVILIPDRRPLDSAQNLPEPWLPWEFRTCW